MATKFYLALFLLVFPAVAAAQVGSSCVGEIIPGQDQLGPCHESADPTPTYSQSSRNLGGGSHENDGPSEEELAERAAAREGALYRKKYGVFNRTLKDSKKRGYTEAVKPLPGLHYVLALLYRAQVERGQGGPEFNQIAEEQAGIAILETKQHADNYNLDKDGSQLLLDTIHQEDLKSMAVAMALQNPNMDVGKLLDSLHWPNPCASLSDTGTEVTCNRATRRVAPAPAALPGPGVADGEGWIDQGHGKQWRLFIGDDNHMHCESKANGIVTPVDCFAP